MGSGASGSGLNKSRMSNKSCDESGSRFGCIQAPEPDLIFTLNQQFRDDKRPEKLTLAIGAYKSDDGKPWLLPSVKKAEEVIAGDFQRYNKEYQPQQGYPGFIKVARELLLGEDHPVLSQGNIATCNTLSGTGALYLCFLFVKRTMPNARIYMPNYTWTNHYEIFRMVYGETARWHDYAYLRQDGKFSLDFEQMYKDLEAAPDGSVVLIHASAHNPSGIDINKEQYQRLLPLFKRKNLFPLFDTAYQGFATGSFEDDGYAPRLFARENVECLVAQSFAKNFGLYGERVGAIHVVLKREASAEAVKRVQATLAYLVRCVWSSGPVHGSYIVEIIGNDPELKRQFMEDVKTMADRIARMRRMFYDEIKRLNVPGDWENVLTCVGMFTFTGLSPKQVHYLREKHALYLVPQGGRMTMCGLTPDNIPRVAANIQDAVLNCPRE